MPEFDNMVCLVGENPLPIWLGIHQFASKSRPVTVVLLYSGATEDVAKNIKSQLVWERDKRKMHQVNCICDNDGKIADPFSPQSVRDALGRLETRHKLTATKYALNYTGGTKVMSAHALLHWSQKEILAKAFYLEEANAQFHFDTGDPEKLRLTTPLTLEALCELHDASKLLPRPLPDCNFDDCSAILKRLLYEDRNMLANKLNGMGHSWTDSGKYISKNVRYLNENRQFDWLEAQRDSDTEWKIDCKWGDLLSLLPLTTAQRWAQKPFPTKADYKKGREEMNAQFRFFVSNFWFEMWVFHLLSRILGASKGIVSGQEFRISGQRFESDILTVVDHRLCYISVTTNPDEDACKEKMFEAIHRSKQIGGGLARSCVITLAGENYNGEDIVLNCRRSLTGRDNGGNHTIFGVKDVEQWMNPTDPCANLHDFLYRKGDFAK